jgi:hypothetical protein
LGAGDGEGLGDVVGVADVAAADVVDLPVEVGAGAEGAADGDGRQLLDDVVGVGVEVAHVVAVDQVDAALLAGADQEVRVGGAAGGVRQQEGPPEPRSTSPLLRLAWLNGVK